MPRTISDSAYRKLQSIFNTEFGGGQDPTPPVEEQSERLYDARALVLHVEDGDTWYGRHRAGPHHIAATDSPGMDTPGVWYRLVGIDTAETGGDNAERAAEQTQFTRDFIAQGQADHDGNWPFRIVWGDAQNEIEGTYGRQLVDLQRHSDGRSLSSALLDEYGDDVRYQG